MPGENTDRGPGGISSLHQTQREQILAAIILLLGPDTDYAKRQRASQRLARAGADVLPLLLQTLHTHPEIATPAWPWWPPQYEQIGRLLIQLSQSARLSLADLLHTSYLSQPPGPVLWTSVIEAMGQLPHMEYEPMLRAGLEAPWWTVRYAAATAIANRAVHISLCPSTREALYERQQHDPETHVRLVAACALLRCADSSGLEVLSSILEDTGTSSEIRRAALFILASELPVPGEPAQKNHLATLLLQALQDDDQPGALYAARALRSIANPGTLPELDRLLDDPRTHTLLATLIALEELAGRKTLRYAIQQNQLARHIALLLTRPEAELRRQACCTLATIGGEYATAMLGVSVLNDLHPAHLEAIEALRLLPDLHHPPVLARVMRWFQHVFTQPIDQAQARALDSLSSLIWHAHAHRRPVLMKAIFRELQQNGCLLQLLSSANPWTRQRTIELLGLVDAQLTSQRALLLEMLHHDVDSNVRASLARLLGQTAAQWAISDLLLALLDPDEQVAESVLHALTALPLIENPLIQSAIQEIAAYHLPLNLVHQRRRLAHAARTWLKQHAPPGR